ncbi:MAG: hypothetical protein PUP91_33015 [Rhizonema sp. PD37]|nr:hypothetical protein [Rhizonema sp. PD37]
MPSSIIPLSDNAGDVRSAHRSDRFLCSWQFQSDIAPNDIRARVTNAHKRFAHAHGERLLDGDRF